MNDFYTYYDLLGVSNKVSPDEIKSAYRKTAKIYHPDVNKDDINAHIVFSAINNAYAILSDSKKRAVYDNFLNSSVLVSTTSKNKRSARRDNLLVDYSSSISLNTLLSHINILLWDIELFISDNKMQLDQIIDNLSLRKHLIKILTTIDAWILYPSGFVDYFMEARNMKALSIEEYIHFIDEGDEYGHRPFYTLDSYYYDIRKRIDRFINKAQRELLYEIVEGTDLRLFECILRVQNYAIDYVSSLQKILNHENGCIPSLLNL